MYIDAYLSRYECKAIYNWDKRIAELCFSPTYIIQYSNLQSTTPKSKHVVYRLPNAGLGICTEKTLS